VTDRTPEQAGGNVVPQEESRLDPNGCVLIRDLIMCPSALWSPQFRAYHAEFAAASAASALPVPARTASPQEWQKFHEWWDQQYNAGPLQRTLEDYPVVVTTGEIAGVKAARVRPRGGGASANEHRILINLHGGGFVYNDGLSFGLRESIPIAAIGAIEVITLDYRQAPFHSFPAASDDVEAVYRELLRQYVPEAIGLFGASAGGTLVAQSLARFQAVGLPKPAAVGIFNIAPMPHGDRPPWNQGWGDSGLWFSGRSPKNKMAHADEVLWNPARWYMESAEAADPQAYPGSSPSVLKEFPPTLLLSGTRDFAMSAVVFTHAYLLKLGVDASLYVMEGGTHMTHVLAVGTPEAHDAQTHIARWFSKQLA
jgi:acetyl esterase/lipase